ITNIADQKTDLSTARSNLKQLLSDDSFNIVSNKLPDQQGENKQPLSEFHQQINGALDTIKTERANVDHHLLLYKQNIVTASMLEQSKAKLHHAWNNLLDSLDGDIFNISNDSAADQEKKTTMGLPSLHLQTPKYQSAFLRLKQKASNALQKVQLNY